MNKAIEGMLDSLDDPYTGFMDETSSDRFNKQLDGTYEGLGAEITTTVTANTTYIYIVSICKNTPAEKAGLQVNDKIVSIDDKSLLNEPASSLTDYVKKSENSEF